MPLDDEALKQIGRVTVNFASMEFQVGFVIAALMGVSQDIGLMVTSEQSFQRKLDLLISLLKHWEHHPRKLPHVKPRHPVAIATLDVSRRLRLDPFSLPLS